jgi:predicted Zn-dependent protease
MRRVPQDRPIVMSHETMKTAEGPGPLNRGRKPSGKVARFTFPIVIVAILGVAGGTAAWVRSKEHFQRELGEARKEMEAGLFGLAGKRLNLLAEERPGQPEVAYELGRCLAARGQMDAALKLWAKVPANSEWAGPAAVEFAQGAISLGRLAEAERSLRQAVTRRGPEQSVLRRLLLTLLGQMGRIAEARQLIASLWQDTSGVSGEDSEDRLRLLREHMGLELETFPLEWNLSQLGDGTAGTAAEDLQFLSLARAHLETEAGQFDLAKRELEGCRARRPDDPLAWKASLRWALAAGRADAAGEAMDHLPDNQFTGPEGATLLAWFARQRHDEAAEGQALEELLAMTPADIPSLTRLAEILAHRGESAEARTLTSRKVALDAALDRYTRLYREDRLAEHLPELASLAEQLGRRFEARGFWELVRRRDSVIREAVEALSRLAELESGRQPSAGKTARVLADLRAAARDGSGSEERAVGEALLIPQFEDRSETSGLAEFVQDNGVTPDHQLPEMSSGGVALLDFDGDGWLDVFCVGGGRFPPETGASAQGDRLFRNRGDGTFLDVTEKSRIGAMPRGYGHGVAVGDYDNDGHPDLFVTRWRSYALYRNRGDGTFEDRTAQAGLDGDRDWPTSAAFADLDNDGDLDLYVCHYGVWDSSHPKICKDPSGQIVLACDPRGIESRPDHLFRNDAGRFADVTRQAGIVDRDGRGLGVVAADLDEDGRVDLVVANDTTANFLFLNRGGFRFEEGGHAAGVAASAQGGYQAGMGVACGDLDGDGRIDLAVTNYYGESTSFFHNLGGGLFADHTTASGLAAPSRHRLGFGVACLDANNDGWVDLMTANGYVSDSRPLFPYAMTAQLFLGTGSGKLRDATALAGPPFQQLHVGRGLAIGDLDNDGRVDAVMVSQNEPLVVFHNVSARVPGRSHFITLKLEGTKSNRDGVGAVVTLKSSGNSRIATRFGGGSFQSAGDPRLHFGLGASDRVESIEIRWPSGRVDRHQDVAGDRGYLVRESDNSLQILF